MRITLKKDPEVGDTKIKRWFAFSPVQTEEDDEIRLFEFVTVEQEYVEGYSTDDLGYAYPIYYWKNIRFEDNAVPDE